MAVAFCIKMVHTIIGRAGASPPSRTAAIILYIRVLRRALNLLRASFFSDISIFHIS